MSQKLLNRTEIGPTRQEVGRKAVAQGVGADLLGQGDGLHSTGRRWSGHFYLSIDHREGSRKSASQRGRALLPGRQVGPKGRLRPASEQDDPLLATLAQDPHHAGAQVHVGRGRGPPAPSSGCRSRRAARGWRARAARHRPSPGTSRRAVDLAFVEMAWGCGARAAARGARARGSCSRTPSRHRNRKKVRRLASLRAAETFLSPRRWRSRQEAPDRAGGRRPPAARRARASRSR